MNTVNLAILVRNLTSNPITLTYDPNWDDQVIWINEKKNSDYVLKPNDRISIVSPNMDSDTLAQETALGLIFSSNHKADDNLYEFSLGANQKGVLDITNNDKTGDPKFKMECISADKGSCIIELS